jgi:hypothetical protein
MLQLLTRIRKRGVFAILAAAVLVAAAGMGWLVMVVRADWQPPAAVKPYDPLPSW